MYYTDMFMLSLVEFLRLLPILKGEVVFCELI